MRKEILTAGFACLSLIAAAQSSGNSSQSSSATRVSSPRDIATGQASGKRESSTPSVSEVSVKSPSSANQRVATGDVNGDGSPDVAANPGVTVRESPTKASSGLRESPSKPSSAVRESPTKASTGRCATSGSETLRTSDCDDTDQASSSQSGSNQNATINTTRSNIKSKDAATGQASGKRQYEPVRIQKQ